MAAVAQQPIPSSTGSDGKAIVAFADSAFLPSPNSSSNIVPNSRAIAHLTRDVLQSVLILPASSNTPASSTPEPVANLKRKQPSGSNSNSLNTRFGSFPHSSLLIPAGSQVRSSSGAGFIHILRPTPELWTLSLPHRTQVVYTPDSSYILHRLRVRPGSRIIEAGAGSGSFTHASARAVYNGVHEKLPPVVSTGIETIDSATGSDAPSIETTSTQTGSEDLQGRVLSFEFHADRAAILRHELQQHGLHSVVTVTHRDVCASGFSLPDPSLNIGGNTHATAVFLDLPAPWLAIPNLNRANGSLSQTKAARICCFSPCLEQALRTIAVLREQGWVEEDLVEVAHKRLEVRRLGPGGKEIGTKSRAPGGDDELKSISVEDSVGRLKRQLWHRKAKQAKQRELMAKKRKLDAEGDGNLEDMGDDDSDVDMDGGEEDEAIEAAGEENGSGKLHLFHQGRVVVRTEPELKTHTSYLVFAVLPLPWTEQDEAAAKLKYPIPPRPAPQVNPRTGKDYTSGSKAPRLTADGKLSKNQEKKLRKAAEKAARLAEAEAKSSNGPEETGADA
ncbi:hypothetical protein H072_6210 [Dactylellina haptotyla CBS 200.50]|uniref:tRNA (adenine(58)-N(1))-methyltransferase catalytic subunit TRM61 n=1 Tax=Dactylellina haptotyla (strain CBS 200.50) TaxID=1284197 RepID=S8BKS7_DACHA|nr:hypothetical protein H072_6210 [Dactylellina haptotyla CBS 200.50]